MKPSRAGLQGAPNFADESRRTATRAMKPATARRAPPTSGNRHSERSHAADPADTPDPWMSAIRRGDFPAAWAISDAVLHGRAGKPCWHLPRHEQYLWRGESLADKRVLVHCYHGLGDTIQFIRYAPLLKQVAREVLVWAQPCLLPLLGTVAGIDQLLPLHDGPPEVGRDADIELMELPHYFRTTLDTLPATVPYIRVPRTVDASPFVANPPRVRHSNDRTGGARSLSPQPSSQQTLIARESCRDAAPLHIGVVWQSGDWDDRRSVPTALLEPLAHVPGLQLHALQLGAALSEWPAEWGGISATPDVTELARRMGGLDLVISVDSFPAHLAGALGVRTWTLLHADPDWRWMLGRDDSPWYPTMQLWRQDTPGDWRHVIRRISEALH